jgi:hypothetical protein
MLVDWDLGEEVEELFKESRDAGADSLRDGVRVYVSRAELG